MWPRRSEVDTKRYRAYVLAQGRDRNLKSWMDFMKRNRKDPKGFSRRDFIKTTAAGASTVALGGFGLEEPKAQGRPAAWDKEADVVVVGAGATGLPAAIQAAEEGSSVILIDANSDVGGHAILSGGNVALGGGTSRQKKYGVVDSPDLLFADLTDWSVVEPNGFPDYRYNDKEIIRAFADNSAPTYDFLVAHCVIFVEKTPDNAGRGRPCAHRHVGDWTDQAARGERTQARRGNSPQASDDRPHQGTRSVGKS